MVEISPAESFLERRRIPASARRANNWLRRALADLQGRGGQQGVPGRELGAVFLQAETPPGLQGHHPQHGWGNRRPIRRDQLERPCQASRGQQATTPACKPTSRSKSRRRWGFQQRQTDHGKPAGEGASIGRPYQRCFSAPSLRLNATCAWINSLKMARARGQGGRFRSGNRGRSRSMGTWSCAPGPGQQGPFSTPGDR